MLHHILRLFLVLISLILTPLLLTLFVLPVILLRLISILSSKLFLHKNTHILSPISSVFTPDNLSKPRCTLVLVTIVDGLLDLKTVLDRVNAVMDTGKYPELHQRLKRWFFFWFWEDCPTFDLNNHVHYHYGKIDDAKLRITREELLKKPFDKNKPLWEAFIYSYSGSGEDKSEKSAIIFRIHHCVADGYSLLSGFQDFNENVVETGKPHFPHRSFLDKVTFWLRFLTLTPVDLFLSNYMARDVNNFKIKKFSGESSRFEADCVEFEMLRRISKKFRVSVSAVIFSGFTAGIRDIFEKKKWNIPTRFHIPCALPVDMKFGQRKNLTNSMSVLPFPSPVNEPNPILRLRQVERIFKRKKNSELALGYSLIFQFCGLIASIRNKGYSSSFGSAFWINFPGPRNQQYLFGKKLECFKFSSDFHNDNVALGFASICFNGRVLISCRAEENLFSDPSITREFVERVFEEYKFLDNYVFCEQEDV